MYITLPPLIFDTSSMIELEKKVNVECPIIDKSNFDKLMAYSVEHNFGIN